MREARMRAVTLACALAALLALLLAPGVHAQDDAVDVPAEEALRVIIKPLAPFVFEPAAEETTVYRGFSIDLWEEVAHRINRPTTYVYTDTVQSQLESVASGTVDVGITGISITREREEMVDFSQPYFQAGLQIMVPAQNTANWSNSFGAIAGLATSPGFLVLVSGLGVAILLMGHLFWLVERRRNPDFPPSYLRGVWEGIWYTVVTLVTVGYGDRTARTVVGRLLAMVWMFVGLLIVANFTANLTSQLTVNQFRGPITSTNDLPGKRVATVAESTAAAYLDDRRIRYRGVETIEEAYPLLEEGRVDAIVYDSPVLLYYAINEGNGRVRVVGDIFEPQNYGIAFPPLSTERELVNRTLLEIQEDGTYAAIYDRWFTAQ
jgi:ABC-type amino acid transport substrate-binding protein